MRRDAAAKAAVAAFPWRQWYHDSGLPPVADGGGGDGCPYDPTLAAASVALADAWLAAGDCAEGRAPTEAVGFVGRQAFDGWTSGRKCLFLEVGWVEPVQP